MRGALHEINRSFDRADLSVSRGAGITRDGLRITVATPKTLTVVVGGKRPLHTTVPALTVRQALKALHVTLGKHDVVRPRLSHVLGDGDKVVLTRVRIVQKQVAERVGRGPARSAATTPRCCRARARSSAPAAPARAT